MCKSCWDRRRYRQQRTRLLALNRRWREANPDYWKQPHIYARVRQWHRDHPERTAEILQAALRRRRARMSGADLGDPKLTEAYCRIIRTDPCAYCGAPASDVDHIDAISRDGSHSWENLTAACRTATSASTTSHCSAFFFVVLVSAHRPARTKGRSLRRAWRHACPVPAPMRPRDRPCRPPTPTSTSRTDTCRGTDRCC